MTEPQELHRQLVEESQPSHFNFDEVDRLLIQADPDGEGAKEMRAIWEDEERCSVKGEILHRFIEAVIPDNVGIGSCQSIGLRVIALAWMIGVQKGNIASRALADIAKDSEVTRAILSYWVRRYEEAFGIHARGQKRKGSIESYRECVHRGWETRRARKAERESSVEDDLTDGMGGEVNHPDQDH